MAGGRFGRALFRPIDGASLAAFRIAFGLLMLLESARFLGGGRIEGWFHEPAFHFTYAGFGWVEPWPRPGMHVHFVALGLLAAGIALGLRARLCAALFGLGFLHVFLIEKARYLNHYYLVLLLCALLAVVPAAACASLDARRAARPRASRCTVPAWALLLLRAQVGLVYLHAGLAKLNPDWLAGAPLDAWLPARADHRVLGPLLVQPWAGLAFSYGGLLLDLLAWPALAWRPTRVPALLLLAAFHLANSTLFGIGIFPWVMLASTTVFLAPDWPRRLAGRLRRTRRGGGHEAPDEAPGPERERAVAAPARDGAGEAVAGGRAQRPIVAAFVVAWIAFQALFPLRHVLYPGSVHWTEEGHAFSWHMKLRAKSGQATFRVTDPSSGETLLVDPALELLPWQARKMAGRPDMLLQYGHHLAEQFSPEGGPRVQVRATASVSLNGHPPRLLVDPAVDLAAQRWSLWRPAPWILR